MLVLSVYWLALAAEPPAAAFPPRARLASALGSEWPLPAEQLPALEQEPRLVWALPAYQQLPA